MKHLVCLSILMCLIVPMGNAETLSQQEVRQDLKHFSELLQQHSSYQGLNGYDFTKDVAQYLDGLNTQTVDKSDFGLFLSTTLGKIGDRHSSIKGYELPNDLFFPFALAPYSNKVVVLRYERSERQYKFWNPDYPYLTSINNIALEELLPKISPKDAMAPKAALFTKAVRNLRDIERVFATLNMSVPNPIKITLSNQKGQSKTVEVKLVGKEKRQPNWDEKFYRMFSRYDDEDLNKQEIANKFFKRIDKIGYIQIPTMLDRTDSPVFFDTLNKFMHETKDTKALIIDVRSNGGGTRDLIQELAGYFVTDDVVEVVNVCQQRGQLPLGEEQVRRLHGRYLLSYAELDNTEQAASNDFMRSFSPTYDLDENKYSENYFYVLNGAKLSKNKYHYDKPVYILANERSFSAASVLVAVFKGLTNIKTVGITTDGSSGNSKYFYLPNSGLRVKLSTMVSFQKDGNVLDGTGTAPDIRIARNIEQILWKDDFQLSKLIEIISAKSVTTE